MPNFWEKLHTQVKNTFFLKKVKVLNLHCAGGVSTPEYEILPCKTGRNPGDVAISSPGTLGIYFLFDFLRPTRCGTTKIRKWNKHLWISAAIISVPAYGLGE